MNKDRETHTRPLTRSRAKPEDTSYTNDDLVIIEEFNKLISQVPSQIIKNNIFHIKTLFQSNTINKQQDLDSMNQEIHKINPLLESTKTELSSTKIKLTNSEKENKKLLQESEEQISNLTQENKNLKITIDSLQQQNKYQKLLIEEKEETIKKQHHESTGQEFLINSLKNTIQNLSQKTNSINYYKTTQYNSSFDVSSLMGNECSMSEINLCNINENSTSSSLTDLYNLQSEMDAINKKQFSHGSQTVKNHQKDDTETTNKNTEITKHHTETENNITTNSSKSENSQRYLTPEIEILNNKSLQYNLESNGIINKSKNTKTNTVNNNEMEIISDKHIDINNQKSYEHHLQKQIDDLREQTNIQEIQIKDILEIIDQSIPKDTSSKPTKISVSTTTSEIIENKKVNKNKCYLIGDFHLNNIECILKNNKEFIETFELRTNISRAYKLEQIIREKLPKSLDKNDLLIISGGTNDLYSTNSKNIQETIIKIQNLNIKTIIMSIPPQNCLLTNKDIQNFNTIIKHQINRIENIYMINTHKIIKMNQLDNDGTTLTSHATKKLGNKIIKTIHYILRNISEQTMSSNLIHAAPIKSIKQQEQKQQIENQQHLQRQQKQQQKHHLQQQQQHQKQHHWQQQQWQEQQREHQQRKQQHWQQQQQQKQWQQEQRERYQQQQQHKRQQKQQTTKIPKTQQEFHQSQESQSQPTKESQQPQTPDFQQQQQNWSKPLTISNIQQNQSQKPQHIQLHQTLQQQQQQWPPLPNITTPQTHQILHQQQYSSQQPYITHKLLHPKNIQQQSQHSQQITPLVISPKNQYYIPQQYWNPSSETSNSVFQQPLFILQKI